MISYFINARNADRQTTLSIYVFHNQSNSIETSIIVASEIRFVSRSFSNKRILVFVFSTTVRHVTRRFFHYNLVSFHISLCRFRPLRGDAQKQPEVVFERQPICISGYLGQKPLVTHITSDITFAVAIFESTSTLFNEFCDGFNKGSTTYFQKMILASSD